MVCKTENTDLGGLLVQRGLCAPVGGGNWDPDSWAWWRDLALGTFGKLGTRSVKQPKH